MLLISMRRLASLGYARVATARLCKAPISVARGTVARETITRLAIAGAIAGLLAGCGGGSPGGESTAVAGNAAHGKELYTQCEGCHKLAENFVGPHHCGVIGRPAGSVPDYEYSEAMKASGVTWSPKTLDEFLTSPIAYVSGTKMGFAGFESATDRADVIAWLAQANADPALCPKS